MRESVGPREFLLGRMVNCPDPGDPGTEARLEGGLPE